MRIGAGKAKTVSVSPGTLTWHAAAYDTDELWQIQPGQGSVQIDATCPPPENPAPDNTNKETQDHDPLPNTGGPVTWWLGPAGLATAVTGLALLLRPRRRRS